MASSRHPKPIGLAVAFLDQAAGATRSFHAFATSHPTGYYVAPASSGRRARKTTFGADEITVVGDFPRPWRDVKDEIDALQDDRWFPSTDDFIAVEVNSRKTASKKPTKIVGSVEAFIHLILDQPAGSIKRINIITHGNSNSVAFSGEIHKDGGVSFDEELDIGVLQALLMHGIVYKGRTVDWKEVESRFGQNAEVVIYACKAAISENLLQDLAEFLDVTVKAFDRELHYTFDELDASTFNRRDILVEGEKDLNEVKPNVLKRPQLKNPFE